MNRKEFELLGPGDIVRHRSGSRGYIVTANYGERVTAVRTVDLTNPDEWDVVYCIKDRARELLEKTAFASINLGVSFSSAYPDTDEEKNR